MHCLSGLPFVPFYFYMSYIQCCNQGGRKQGNEEGREEVRQDSVELVKEEEGGSEASLYLTLELFWSNETFITWRLVYTIVQGHSLSD